MTNLEAQRKILEGAIGHCRCVIGERHQSVESQSIARANMAKYQARLQALAA